MCWGGGMRWSGEATITRENGMVLDVIVSLGNGGKPPDPDLKPHTNVIKAPRSEK